ncbi:FecR family protein [Pedobacter nyackensis]|uniref:FecR family protein n=1 Tax=Pedobacter nyackensis TaxID=475255 RepID=A0A1W2AJQ9_9SPHI|nr:FecR domain-containing protein [Pedobacter nyackensis]SMC60969.1 FecR family protein [Pedobacter nyackensis]
MKKERANYLYERYVKNELTADERLEWEDLGLNLSNDHFFQELVDGLWEVKDDDIPAMKAAHANQIEQCIIAQPQPLIIGQRINKSRLWPRIAAAAAILLVIAAGLFYYTNTSRHPELVSGSRYVNDIAPGKNTATLTLANGKQIVLSDALNGELVKEAGLSISKTADGQIVYEIKDQGNPEINKTNTLSTANGETYRVRLPDGSLVVLNAASKLTYATALNEHGVRRVTLTGEAYFEISKDKKHPFIVITDKQEVEVLGTHFNISAYKDEQAIKTTLLEGSIKVRAQNSNKILRPGQQAELTGANQITVKTVDVTEAVAWKDGDFVFRAEPLESIMRKVARWYDVEVEYAYDAPRDIPLTAVISRSRNISSVLEGIVIAGNVHFKVEGKRVYVSR